ncbi:MAG: MATE family efflux transporter, partial [Methanobacteriaceae archaeon]|nr:MATE family efflux transporter [Methanobacteriaceae archaeon]
MEYNINKYVLSKVYNSLLSIGIIQAILMNISIIIIGILIGRFVGEVSLMAYGLSIPVETIIVAVSSCLSNGSMTLSSKYLGRNDKNKSNQIFTITCLLIIILGLIITSLIIIFSKNIAWIIGANSFLFNLTSEYIIGLTIGFIPYLFQVHLMNYTRMDGYNNLTIYSVISILITQILLVLVTIIYFNGSMFGIGLSISLSYIVGSLVYLLHFFNKNNSIYLTRITNISSSTYQIFKYGFSSGLNQIGSTISGIILNNVVINIGGVIAIGVLTINNNIYMLVSAILFKGITNSVLILSGILNGESNYLLIEKLAKISFKKSMIISIIIMIILFIIAPIIASLYTSDVRIINMSIVMIRLYSLSLIPASIICILIGYYNSINKIGYLNYFTFANSFIFLFIPIFIFEPFIGVDAVWVAFCL